MNYTYVALAFWQEGGKFDICMCRARAVDYDFLKQLKQEVNPIDIARKQWATRLYL